MTAAASPGSPWQGGDAYERFMGRWSRRLVQPFLDWVDVPPARRWLDVGCGTGALTAAILARCAPASVAGADPSEGFLASARTRLPATVALHQAPAQALPLADASVDATVASLVLNFVPDSAAALREMARVTAPGGRVAACVWDYAQRMQMLGHYWAAAQALGLLDSAGVQAEHFPICAPDALGAAFRESGLQSVEVSAIEIETRFADFDDYWLPFLGGQGIAPAHAMRQCEADRARLREAIRAELPYQPDGSIVLVARAWAARGTV